MQNIAFEALLTFAHEHDMVLQMGYGSGEFVVQGRPIAWFALDAPPDKDMIKAVNRMYAIDAYRTVDQDAAFGIRQLVDIVLKALSPGINDTTTAITCIEFLTVILRQCASRRIESPHCSREGKFCVLAKGPTFEDFIALSFNQILESAEGNTVVITAMLTAIKQVSEVARGARRRDLLVQQMQVIAEVKDRGVKSNYARRMIEDHARHVRESLIAT
jgi:uncharacterized membrane protein